MRKESRKAERNQKFMDFYNAMSSTDEFLALKTHKRVRYLREEFGKRENCDIPIGTIYKLLRTNTKQTDEKVTSTDQE